MREAWIRIGLALSVAGISAGLLLAALVGGGRIPVIPGTLLLVVCAIGLLTVAVGILLLELAATRHDRELADDVAIRTITFVPQATGSRTRTTRLRRVK